MSHHHPSAEEHGAAHVHAPADYNTAFAVGVALNLGFVVVEGIFGVVGHSLALLADAGHNLGDVFGLLLAWGASALARKLPTKSHTYGFRSSSILAALFNAVLLLVAVGAIAWEAIERFSTPTPVAGATMVWVALIGVGVNTATALLFVSGRKGDLNIRGAFLHMAADAAVSLGVVLAGLAILWTGQHWIDPVTSLVIVAVIVAGTWGLFRDSLRLALHAIPPGIDFDEVKQCLAQLPGVIEVHDLHIWAMSTTETALTAHLVRREAAGDDARLAQAAHDLRERHHICHSTLQFESPEHTCLLAPEDAV